MKIERMKVEEQRKYRRYGIESERLAWLHAIDRVKQSGSSTPLMDLLAMRMEQELRDDAKVIAEAYPEADGQ